MKRARTLRTFCGLGMKVVGMVVWILAGIAISKFIMDIFSPFPRKMEIASLVVMIIIGFGGLGWFWSIDGELLFLKRGYRIVQMPPREYLKWSKEKLWAYQEWEIDGRVRQFPFIRVLLADGYPARTEVRLPREDVWNIRVPKWAQNRRKDISDHIANLIGADIGYGRIVEID